MMCDHKMAFFGGCKNTPDRAPRLVVPPRGNSDDPVRPLRMFTTMHFCEIHKGEVKAEDLLSPRVKRDFEEAARRKWPLGVRPDFDKASIEYVLTTTPEYRQFLQSLGSGGILRAAIGAARLAG